MSNILIYTMTNCPHCIRVKTFLKSKGIAFQEVNLDENPDRWDECEKKTGRQTVPQIFIDDKHIGGCDDFFSLYNSKSLKL